MFTFANIPFSQNPKTLEVSFLLHIEMGLWQCCDKIFNIKQNISVCFVTFGDVLKIANQLDIPLFFNKKSSFFSILTRCVWCIPKNRQKFLLNFEQNLERKTAKRAYISIHYWFTIKKLSIGYQNQEFTTENISICN
jgi:hypothetical protein